MSSIGLACEPEDVRMEVARILSSKDFEASERNRRFLQHIVEETISGRADRIKAYSIATSVFGRNESFDPQHDAIVRIEAGRMRRSLEHYYLTSGVDDSIRISIPVGSYVPVFSRKQTDADPKDQSGEGQCSISDMRHMPILRPTIYVSEFVVESEETGQIRMGQGITRRLIIGLTRFKDLAVVGSDCPDGDSETNNIAILRAERGVDFLLSGAIGGTKDCLSIEALLRDTLTGRYVWSDYFEVELVSGYSVSLRNAIANRIVDILGQPSGVILSYMARDAVAKDRSECESFESVMRFHDYWRTFDRDQFEPVRQALERTIERDPHYSEAFACLSQLYSNSVRYGYKGIAHNIRVLQRAITLAQRAIRISPGSSRAYFALAIAYWFDGQADSAFDALHTSRALNPNDMEVVAELGLRYAFRADWKKGVPLIEEAYRRSPALPATYRIGLSMWHFVHGRFKEAMFEARKIDMPGVIYPYIMIAASANRLGLSDQATAALDSLIALSPDYGSSVVADLERRNLHPDIISVVVEGLKDAGFACIPAAVPPLKHVPGHL